MLKVWLPLDGDLRNLGASDIEVTNNGATVDNAGKIGKCYSFDGTNDYIVGTYQATTNISFCCWVNFPTIPAGRHLFDARTPNGTGYQPMFINTSSIQIGGSGSSYQSIGYPWIANTWYHICVTHNQNNGKLYINGDLIAKTTAKGFEGDIYNFTLGSRCNQANYCSAKINDVRIYDHCLSAAEVKEIAQGLVLHYKLDDPYIEETTNLCTSGTLSNSCYNGATGKYSYGTNTDIYKTQGIFQNKYCTKIYMGTAGQSAYPYVFFDYLHPLENQYKTLSFDYFPTSQNRLIFYTYNGGATASYTINGSSTITGSSIPVILNQWNHITLTLLGTSSATSGWGYVRIGTVAHTSTITDYWLFANIQIEEKDHATPYTPNSRESNNIIQDSSGYGHNGEIVSELHLLNDSTRYENSTLFDGVDDCIIVPYNAVCPENIFTINLWFKKDALGSKNYETLFGGPSGFEMDTRAGSATSLSLYMASTRSSNRATGITMNEWHMITMTRDGTIEKYYVDGEFKSEIEAKSMPNGVYRIGAWAANDKQNYYGQISDFRIYCTPLLDTDIKLLYNISMRVDNLGGIHTFEFHETNSRELLAGIPITSSYSNHTNIYTNYTNGEIKLTGSSSVSTPYIPISPSGKTYYYDLDVSMEANNQIYIGFERYDANKTARSNNATTYIVTNKPSTNLSHQRYRGIVNLSTDGVNPCAFITLRILNDWSGAANRSMTVHKISLREVTTIQSPKLYKTGIFTVDELNEHLKSSLYKNGFVEATEFIEI